MSEMFMTAAFHSGRRESCFWPCTLSKKRDLAWLTPTTKESARCEDGGVEFTNGKKPGVRLEVRAMLGPGGGFQLITANWEAGEDNRWTVPIGGSVLRRDERRSLWS